MVEEIQTPNTGSEAPSGRATSAGCALVVLKELEWSAKYSYCTGWPCCPICKGIKPGHGSDEAGRLPLNQGHRETCRLAAAIAVNNEKNHEELFYGGCEQHRDRIDLSCARIRRVKDGLPLTTAEVWAALSENSKQGSNTQRLLHREFG